MLENKFYWSSIWNCTVFLFYLFRVQIFQSPDGRNYRVIVSWPLFENLIFCICSSTRQTLKDINVQFCVTCSPGSTLVGIVYVIIIRNKCIRIISLARWWVKYQGPCFTLQELTSLVYSDDHHLSVEYTGVCDMCTTLLHYKDPPLFMRSELYRMVFSMVFETNRFAGLPEKTKSPFVLVMSFQNWLKLVLNVEYLLRLFLLTAAEFRNLNFNQSNLSEKKLSMKNIWLGDQLLILYFLKLCPIFVSSVHDFGKSEDDIF